MSKKQINLIPRITEEELRASQLTKTTNLIAYSILFVSLLLVTATFAYKSFLLKSITKQNENIEQSVIELENVRSKESVLKGIEIKLARIKKLYNEYPSIAKVIGEVQALATNQAVVSLLSAEEGKLEFTLQSKNRVDTDTYLNSFKELSAQQNFKNIRINNLQAETNRSYTTNISFNWDNYGKN